MSLYVKIYRRNRYNYPCQKGFSKFSRSKTLFGTLDDADAESYDKQIRELQDSRNNLLKIVEKQTSIIKAIANTFKGATQMECLL